MYKPKSSNGISNNFSSGYEEKMDTHEDVDSYHDEGAANLDKVLCIHLFNPTVNI